MTTPNDKLPLTVDEFENMFSNTQAGDSLLRKHNRTKTASLWQNYKNQRNWTTTII